MVSIRVAFFVFQIRTIDLMLATISEEILIVLTSIGLPIKLV